MRFGGGSLKSLGLTHSLETQMKVDSVILKKNFFFFGKPQFLILRSFNWLGITKVNLLYFKSIDCSC